MKDELISRELAINAIYHHFPWLSKKESAEVLHEVPSIDVYIFNNEKGEQDE